MRKIVGYWGKTGWFAQVVVYNSETDSWWSTKYDMSGESPNSEPIVRAVCAAWAQVLGFPVEVTEINHA